MTCAARSSVRVLSGRDRTFTVSVLFFVALAALLVCNPAVAQDTRTERLVAHALKLSPRKNVGTKLFGELCARCHGDQAQGDPTAVTPALAGQLKAYVIKQLADMAEANRPAAEMHRLVARIELTRAQTLSDIAGHISSLPRISNPQSGDGRQLSTGERIFASACAQCHGFQAEGDSHSTVPALQGQHYSYLLMQMRQMPVSHRASIGVETLERFEDLTLEDLAAVSDYISRIKARAPHESVVRAID